MVVRWVDRGCESPIVEGRGSCRESVRACLLTCSRPRRCSSGKTGAASRTAQRPTRPVVEVIGAGGGGGGGLLLLREREGWWCWWCWCWWCWPPHERDGDVINTGEEEKTLLPTNDDVINNVNVINKEEAKDDDAPPHPPTQWFSTPWNIQSCHVTVSVTTRTAAKTTSMQDMTSTTWSMNRFMLCGPCVAARPRMTPAWAGCASVRAWNGWLWSVRKMHRTKCVALLCGFDW